MKERRGDGKRVKVRREVAGRRGRAATTISGVPVDDAGLRALAGRLKKRCGVGGSVKDGVIEIQGDHRTTVMPSPAGTFRCRLWLGAVAAEYRDVLWLVLTWLALIALWGFSDRIDLRPVRRVVDHVLHPRSDRVDPLPPLN